MREIEAELVKLDNRYRQQLFDMLDEWYSAGEEIVPYAITKGIIGVFGIM